MELRQLEYFVSVAVELNFSRAAARMHVVQSALSTSVAKLERELGVELIDRSRRQIALSPAGVAFLDQAYGVLAAAKRAKNTVTEYQGQLAGTVEVGTLMSSGALDLPAVLGRFHRRHPLVNVRLRQSGAGSAGHVAEVADGTLDLALISTPGRPTPLVDVEPLDRVPMLFVSSPEHPLADRQRVRLTDLVGEQLIQFAPGWGVRRLLEQALASAGLVTTTAYEVADYATAAGLARHGLGVTVMPATEARRFTDLRHIPLTPAVVWTLYLAAAPVRHRSPAAATLADEFVAEAAGTVS
ncbi:MAG: LysR family transcriptional regulator [Mycobacterium sp.]